MGFKWKWLDLRRIYSLNYGDQIIKSFIVSSYVKKKLNVLVMMLMTIIIRCFLCSLICVMFSYNLYVDFFLHAFISIVMVLKSHWIYDVVEKKHKIFYSITRYAINNYTPENYRRWKRNTVLCISLYFIFLLLIFEVTSNLLIMYIVQYLLTYFIIDVIEHNKIDKLIKKLKDKPKNKLYNEIDILDNYCKVSEENIAEKDKSKKKNYVLISR